MPVYSKHYLSPRQQLDLLKRRGLQVSDENEAAAALERSGYYRLSAYWFPFRKIAAGQRTDIFLDDSSFEDAIALYRFDKELKILMMDVIERIEIAVRVQIALQLGKRDPFAYEKSFYLNHRFTTPNRSGVVEHDIWLDRFDSMVDRSSEDFVRHHMAKYGTNASLPIWIAIELWDFGMTSKFYSGLKGSDQNYIASRFRVVNGDILKSWLRSVNYIRNIIAHHGRLWNRNIVDTPKMPNLGDMADFDVLRRDPNSNKRLYYLCCILAHLSDSINLRSAWKRQFITHLQNFPDMPHAQIGDMGFPGGWEKQSFWK